jgi:hypothetical protein
MCTYCLFALYTGACSADVLDAVVICVEENYLSTELAILCETKLYHLISFLSMYVQVPVEPSQKNCCRRYQLSQSGGGTRQLR